MKTRTKTKTLYISIWSGGVMLALCLVFWLVLTVGPGKTIPIWPKKSTSNGALSRYVNPLRFFKYL